MIRMFDAKKMGFHNSQLWMMCMFLRNGLVQRKQQLESLRWGYTPVNQHSNEKLHLTLMIVIITIAFTTKHGIFNGTMFVCNKGYAPEVQHASPENQLFFRWTSRTNFGVYLDVPEFSKRLGSVGYTPNIHQHTPIRSRWNNPSTSHWS